MKTDVFWCSTCMRTFESTVPADYHVGQIVEEIGQLSLTPEGEEHWGCPYPDCDGPTTKCIGWSAFRQGHPEYPMMPNHGVRYP